ncbi:MAG: T9SS type A sorting domain-containing protein [Bacteroidia bacterium]
MKKNLFFVFFFILLQSVAQPVHRITGFLGIYHTYTGYTYADSTGTDSALIQDMFRFGEMNFPNQSIDHGFGFQQNVDSCNSWNANRVFGIIQPPSEGGVYNQPFDTALLSPFDISIHPGMIQGGQRFSKLSQLYGTYCGVVFDDWNSDTAITHQVRDAVQGKQVDSNGNVDYSSHATTPYNKLFIVSYGTWVPPGALPFIDGFSLWYYDNQNCCYTKLDSDITTLHNGCPGKEILVGIYILNGNLGWTNPVSVQYMLQHALNRYDEGDINGITLFAGPFLDKNSMPLSQWNALALPRWLDSLYYPYLGEAYGKISDCSTGKALPDAFIRVFCKGRVSGDTLFRSSQKTDSTGKFHLGLWAGNRNTDSTYYWLVAEKAGYDNGTIGFWVKRNRVTNIPDFSICVSKEKANPISSDLLIFPNPAGEYLNVRSDLIFNGEMRIIDVLGRPLLIQPLVNGQATLAVSLLKPGFYFLQLRSVEGFTVVKKFVKR